MGNSLGNLYIQFMSSTFRTLSNCKLHPDDKASLLFCTLAFVLGGEILIPVSFSVKLGISLIGKSCISDGKKCIHKYTLGMNGYIAVMHRKTWGLQ